MTNGELLILIVLPLISMPVLMLVLSAVMPKPNTGKTTGRLANYNDLHREAYIGALLTAVITVIAFEIRGGPEPFVLVWMPLLSTVMVLPFGYTLALIFSGLMGKSQIN
jgi:hypothetical protein